MKASSLTLIAKPAGCGLQISNEKASHRPSGNVEKSLPKFFDSRFDTT